MNDKKPLKPTKPIKTEQVEVSKEDALEQMRYKQQMSALARMSLSFQKVMAVNLSFTHDGKVEIVYFGASPEIEARAQFLSTQIADLVPEMMAQYDIPQVDITEDPARG